MLVKFEEYMYRQVLALVEDRRAVSKCAGQPKVLSVWTCSGGGMTGGSAGSAPKFHSSLLVPMMDG
jgi:hypothetical protein